MATKTKVTSEKRQVTRKTAPKAEKAAVTKVETKPGSLNVPVLSLTGPASGNLNLPKEIFGAKVNEALLTQALRVYSTNLKTHWGQTKSRGQVTGSTRKIFRQKGTGNARHGSIRAPIFVGGGVALGPKYRKISLELPKKMKRAALISALSQKVQNGQIRALADLDKATGKTKQVAKFVAKIGGDSFLIIHQEKNDKALRAIRNIPGIDFLNVEQLNAYEVIRHQSLLITKAAVERLEKGPRKQMSEIRHQMKK